MLLCGFLSLIIAPFMLWTIDSCVNFEFVLAKHGIALPTFVAKRLHRPCSSSRNSTHSINLTQEQAALDDPENATLRASPEGDDYGTMNNAADAPRLGPDGSKTSRDDPLYLDSQELPPTDAPTGMG